MTIIEIPAKIPEQKVIRVAAYARVSVDGDLTFHSLEAQRDYYKNYIAAHSNMQLVDIYSDNAISGTVAERPEFQRMLADCRAGKIDLVICKSITRFARNTVILLSTVRELKSYGVDCYFEKENLHSISSDGELLLTLLAMYAEEEARSTSENIRWRIRKSFEEGKAWGGRVTLGYQVVDGMIVMVPEEVEIVRQIFRDYLSGMGIRAIANKLIRAGVKTKHYKKWTPRTIHNILTNEKYTGNLLLQKYCCTDFRTKKNQKNNGLVRQYYVEGSHEAIVDDETFAAVQHEMERRAKKHPSKGVLNEGNEYSPFCGMIRCGICGATYIRVKSCSKNTSTYIWVCHTYRSRGKYACQSRSIPDKILTEKTMELLGLSEITKEVLTEKLWGILIPEYEHLVYDLRDGSSADVYWNRPSKQSVWTEERRQAARERAIRQFSKNKIKNANEP